MNLTTLIAIALIAGVVGFGFSRLFPYNFSWFLRLRRPRWLTFESLIPFIWIFIFICGIASAASLWESDFGKAQLDRTSPQSWLQIWWLMSGYLLLELLILSYTPVLCRLRSLKAGTIVGATGFFWGAFLTFQVWQVSSFSGILLLPFLIWSPIGTYVTWAMIRLNPGAR
jgi:translocator protein